MVGARQPRSPMATRIARSAALGCAALLSACSMAAPRSEFTGWFRGYETCREEYARMDARVERADARDASYHRVPGFPYLRTDRLLASFAGASLSGNAAAEWLRRLREADQEAREYEYANLGMDPAEVANQRLRFLNCGKQLAGLEIDWLGRGAQLPVRVPPPDAYSGWQQAAGALAGLRFGLRGKVERQQRAIRDEYAAPAIADRGAPWAVRPTVDPALASQHFSHAFFEDMGHPALVTSAWIAIAERHAPVLFLGRHVPAAPAWGEQGLRGDEQEPVVFYSIDFARLGADPVVRFTYVIWIAAGPLDASIWRVTVNLRGEVLVRESVHGSGRRHLWFPAADWVPRADTSGWSETQLPQGRLVADAVALSFAVEPLRPVRAEAAPALNSHARRYTLRPYETLYNLPLPRGGTRSLFDANGFVRGPGQESTAWEWASGIRRPGALRQLSHLPVTYLHRLHFDDPFLIEEAFDLSAAR